MAILNSFAGSGGGVRIPLEPPTEFTVLRGNAENTLSWVDPVDKVANPGGEPVSTWAYDVLVRRSDRYPTSPSDGYPVFRNTVKNQGGAGVSYTDTGLTNGVPYYYALYSYTTIGVVSEAATGTATPVGGIVHAGTLTALSGVDQKLAGAAAGSYMVFAGGTKYTATAYDASLTRVNISAIDLNKTAGGEFAAASTANHAIFSGAVHGTRSNSDQLNGISGTCAAVSVYNSSLTLTEYSQTKDAQGASMPLGASYQNQVGCSVEGRALFAYGEGAYGSGNLTYYSNTQVIALNDSLTQTTVYLGNSYRDVEGCVSCGMTSLGNYCFIGPGEYSDRYGTHFSDQISIITSSLTYVKADTHSQTTQKYQTIVASSPTHAFFAGSGTRATVFDTSLTKTTPNNLPHTVTNGAGVKIGEYALFANINGVFAYDHALVQTTPEGLSVPRSHACGVPFEDRALFAGGYSSSSGGIVDTVDVYTA